MTGRALAIPIALAAFLSAAPLDAQKPAGFLRPAPKPNLFVTRFDPVSDRICRSLAALARVPVCPGTLTHRLGPVNFGPPEIVAGNLPHLKLDVILGSMENVLVSGAGVAIDQDDLLQFLYASWLIQSDDADVQRPDADGFGLPAPNPGQVWPAPPFASGLYQGIILNGCSNTTVFDLALDSSIIKDNDTLGSVQLSDTVVGNGFFVFAYSILASDAAGTSNFSFRGDVRAYCTDQNEI